MFLVTYAVTKRGFELVGGLQLLDEAELRRAPLGRRVAVVHHGHDTRQHHGVGHAAVGLALLDPLVHDLAGVRGVLGERGVVHEGVELGGEVAGDGARALGRAEVDVGDLDDVVVRAELVGEDRVVLEDDGRARGAGGVVAERALEADVVLVVRAEGLCAVVDGLAGGAHVHVADGVRREVAGRALLALGVAGGGAGHLVGLASVDDRAAGAVGLEEALLAVAALLRDVLALGAVAADAVVVAAAVLAVLHLLALGARVGATAEVADVAGGADGVVGARALDVVTAGHGHEGDERRGQAAAAALDDGLGLDVGDHGGGALLVVAPEDLEAGALVLAAGLAAQAGLELLGAHDLVAVADEAVGVAAADAERGEGVDGGGRVHVEGELAEAALLRDAVRRAGLDDVGAVDGVVHLEVLAGGLALLLGGDLAAGVGAAGGVEGHHHEVGLRRLRRLLVEEHALLGGAGEDGRAVEAVVHAGVGVLAVAAAQAVDRADAGVAVGGVLAGVAVEAVLAVRGGEGARGALVAAVLGVDERVALAHGAEEGRLALSGDLLLGAGRAGHVGAGALGLAARVAVDNRVADLAGAEDVVRLGADRVAVDGLHEGVARRLLDAAGLEVELERAPRAVAVGVLRVDLVGVALRADLGVAVAGELRGDELGEAARVGAAAVHEVALLVALAVELVERAVPAHAGDDELVQAGREERALHLLVVAPLVLAVRADAALPAAVALGPAAGAGADRLVLLVERREVHEALRRVGVPRHLRRAEGPGAAVVLLLEAHVAHAAAVAVGAELVVDEVAVVEGGGHLLALLLLVAAGVAVEAHVAAAGAGVARDRGEVELGRVALGADLAGAVGDHGVAVDDREAAAVEVGLDGAGDALAGDLRADGPLGVDVALGALHVDALGALGAARVAVPRVVALHAVAEDGVRVRAREEVDVAHLAGVDVDGLRGHGALEGLAGGEAVHACVEVGLLRAHGAEAVLLRDVQAVALVGEARRDHHRVALGARVAAHLAVIIARAGGVELAEGVVSGDGHHDLVAQGAVAVGAGERLDAGLLHVVLLALVLAADGGDAAALEVKLDGALLAVALDGGAGLSALVLVDELHVEVPAVGADHAVARGEVAHLRAGDPPGGGREHAVVAALVDEGQGLLGAALVDAAGVEGLEEAVVGL